MLQARLDVMDDASRVKMWIQPDGLSVSLGSPAGAEASMSDLDLLINLMAFCFSKLTSRSCTFPTSEWKGTSMISWRSVQRMADAQVGKSAVITVGRDPFAAAFDREGGQVCIGDKIAFDAGFLTEAAKDFPMTGPWIDENTIRPVP
jgi:hypothetical protein